MKRLLLHTCCGPCLVRPGEMLKAEYELTCYYYNPNIHPTTEYIERLETLSAYCRDNGFELVVGAYEPQRHLIDVAGLGAARCAVCYHLRLSQAARYAAQNGYDAFSTTLTVSPYQKHDLIEAIGKQAGEERGVKFIYRDFRAFYRGAQETARKLKMYRQSYCGCIYSEIERYEKKLAKAEREARE